jgi:hypothetical protein
MLSLSKTKTTVLLASAALLCTSPLAAAIRTKSSTTRVKGPSAASSSRLTASTSSKSSPHKSGKATVSKGRHGVAAKTAARSQKPRGQQSIDETRTTEIQQALIREHYLNGEATGQWDQATRDALARFQGDNHWQTKFLPDSRALIKLGLGPSQQGLLNPESAAVAIPHQLGVEKSVPGGSN